MELSYNLEKYVDGHSTGTEYYKFEEGAIKRKKELIELGYTVKVRAIKEDDYKPAYIG